MKKVLSIMLLALSTGAIPLFAADSIPLPDFSALFEKLREKSLPPPIVLKASPEIISFKGGKVVGDIDKTENGYIVSGEVGFLLRRDNKGGVLYLDVTGISKNPLPCAIKIYPSADMKPIEENLGDKSIEIEIAQGKDYVYFKIGKDEKLTLKAIEFKEEAGLTKDCDCRQIPVQK